MSIGIDAVNIPAFAEQLRAPGTTFSEVFSARELRLARSRPDYAAHLAGRWAAKEAFIKAWSQRMYGTAPVMGRDDVHFCEIEVVADPWGRVAIELSGDVAEAVSGCLGPVETALSISHDGDYAVAVCQLLAAGRG
ncbi:holo-ACP synthase AcpS [Corynebacterium uterequi]|uniref:Holo-[acyl-carrier-protein] synthase n=1 Tax=Corynebacterium uterequi TaxID=1072256 RepID=A0A0G3HII2_9CORY|nr:holo-ACP synthase [Corynebacterium uterequi]AKK11738.1 phosphopantetheine--protein transferase [Corynebacterium uterequi]